MAAAGPTDIEYMIRKIKLWQAEVSGVSPDAELNDEFAVCERKVRELVATVRRLQDEVATELSKEKTSAVEMLKKRKAIEQFIKQIHTALEELAKAAKFLEKKSPPEKVAARKKVQESYKKIVQGLQENEKISSATVGKKDAKKRHKRRDLDFDEEAFDDEENGLDEEEQLALERFRANDEKIDAEISKVINNLDSLQLQLEGMGEDIKQRRNAMGQLDKQLQVINEEFETQNKRMKKIVKEFRSPQQICIYVVLIIIFLVMCGALYYVSTRK